MHESTLGQQHTSREYLHALSMMKNSSPFRPLAWPCTSAAALGSRYTLGASRAHAYPHAQCLGSVTATAHNTTAFACHNS
jgi:hypothetical protein